MNATEVIVSAALLRLPACPAISSGKNRILGADGPAGSRIDEMNAVEIITSVLRLPARPAIAGRKDRVATHGQPVYTSAK